MILWSSPWAFRSPCGRWRLEERACIAEGNASAGCRQLMGAQAVRRPEAETIMAREAERLGLILPRARRVVMFLRNRIGAAPDGFNFEPGPLGRLL